MKVLLALVALLAIASMTVGSTFAGFSDTDMAVDNSLTTGSLDLKIAKCVDNCEPGELEFYDDEPWGYGLQRCFFIVEVEQDETYTCDLLLWNIGTTDGIASLHLKIVHDLQDYASLTDIVILYDPDGNGPTEVTSGTLSALACSFIPLDLLPGEAQAWLYLQVTPRWEHSEEYELVFDTVFSLVDECPAFSDTEECRNFLDPNPGEVGGTPGYWRSPATLRQHGEEQLAEWFRDIVLSSAWFENDLADGSDEDLYNNMVYILGSVGAAGYGGMVNQFRAQYLATRLNAEAGRLGLDTSHNVSSIDSAETYFGYSSGNLAKIITTIEDKASGGIFSEPPSRGEMRKMKDVCDALNNLNLDI